MASTPTPDETVSIDDIEAAAQRLEGAAARTPLLESTLLNERFQARILVKAESLQRTGSFKFRGAFNRLSQLSKGERTRGVVAFSSGNHAQGVAAAAQALGIAAQIVMPADAPRLKVENTRSYGATVIPYDRVRENREEIARAIAAQTNATLVPPYDDLRIIAGQGTVGLEIAGQLKGFGTRADAVLVPCSGGGLTAGIATAITARCSGTAVFTVEPSGFDDTARSFARGRRVRNTGPETGLCDALLVSMPGRLTFAINARLVAGGLVVEDASVLAAMRLAFERLKLVLEPSGAASIAALLSGAYDPRGKTVVVVASGANVDSDTYRRVLEAHSQ